MKTITEEQYLLERIEHLQIKQDIELAQLKSKVHGSVQLLNPLSLFKSSLMQIDAVPVIKNVALNLTSHYLAKIPLFRIFQQPINKLLGTLANKFSPK